MLRRTASRGAAASDPSNRCLDAEMLAAWIDGDLNAADVSAAEAHVSSCARCQAMVAAIVRTTPSTPAVPWYRRAWAIGLIPLTAGAAAVAIWIATPDVEQRQAPAVAAREAIAIPAPPAAQPSQERFESPPPAALPDSTTRPQVEARGLAPAPPQVVDLRARTDASRREAEIGEAKKELANAAKRDGSRAATVAPAAPAPPPPVAPLGAAEATRAETFRDAAAAAAPQRANERAMS